MYSVYIIAVNTLKALVRKKDLYVFIFMLLILMGALASQQFYNQSQLSRYIMDIGYYCLWLFTVIIAVTFSAKQIPAEMESKTVYPLLAKPVSRFTLIAGRYLGSFLAASAAFTLFYLIYGIFSHLKGGITSPVLFFQTYLFSLLSVSLLCALSVLCSLFMTLSGAATITFIAYFGVMWFSEGVRDMAVAGKGFISYISLGAYYMLPHFEFYDLRIRLVHGWAPVPAWAVWHLIAYTVIYTWALLYLSYLILKRKYL